MNRQRGYYIFLLMFLLLSLSLRAQREQIFVGTRPNSLGEAFVAVADDGHAVYWNPAGIAFLEGTAAGFTHTMLYADMSLEDVAVAMPAMDGVMAVSALAFLSGDIEETTEEMPDGTGETYTANAFSLTLSYARLMTDKFSAGVSFRFRVCLET